LTQAECLLACEINNQTMEEKLFDISFQSGEKRYAGWVKPSEKLNDIGAARSYHVVLENTFFGELSLNNCHWIINQPRPHLLVEAVGKEIEKHFKL
jgi:hypothetical protein